MQKAPKEAPKRGELLGSAKAQLKECGWKFSPSLAIPNPCVHKKDEELESFSAQLTQAPGELEALSLEDCISMPTHERFSSFIKTVENRVRARKDIVRFLQVEILYR